MKILLYFVKYPEPGKVKTRLARDLGNERAAGLYRELAEKNLERLRPLMKKGISLVIAFDPPDQEEKIKSWLSQDLIFLPQRGEGLTERLSQAFQNAFKKGASKVIALGSDTLGLDAELVEKAYDVLDHSDLVLGPARDGGYYLVGLSQPQPGLFENIPWSTQNVLQSTLDRAKQLGLSHFLLRELEDLDRIENLRGKQEVS